MKRTKASLPPLPDAINCQVQNEFTQIPNEFVRNPTISTKAKVVLCILLGNRQGWKSFIVSIKDCMKEGEETVRNAVKELEQLGYLIRLNYRDKKTKQWKGWLWVYSNTPYQYDFKDSFVLLDLHGLEIPNLEKRLRQKVSPEPKKPEVGNPKMGKGSTKNTNIKNNNKKISSSEEEDLNLKKGSNGYIVPKDVFKFLELYPSNRISSKGEVITKWEILCNNKVHRPTWNRIERAIKKQKETPRWQNEKFIPLATTWINQKRWLDDPAQMISYNAEEQERASKQEEEDEREWRRKFGYDK